MDDIAEQQQVASEISNAISNPVGFSDNIDDDELLRELEELQDKELEGELLNIPSAPTTNLPGTSTQVKPNAVASSNRNRHDDEDELAKMAAWANS